MVNLDGIGRTELGRLHFEACQAAGICGSEDKFVELSDVRQRRHIAGGVRFRDSLKERLAPSSVTDEEGDAEADVIAALLAVSSNPVIGE